MRVANSSKSFKWFALSACLLCLSLCVWQIKRGQYKHQLLDAIAENRNKVLSWESIKRQNIVPCAPTPLLGANTVITGRWQADKTFFLGPRTLAGRPGVYVITPFIDTSGAQVLVNRGWMARDKPSLPLTNEELQLATQDLTAAQSSEPQTILQTVPQTIPQLIPQTIHGRITMFARRSYFTPPPNLAARWWYQLDFADLRNYLGAENLISIYITQTPASSLQANPELAPQAAPQASSQIVFISDPANTIPNNHYGYAVTWFLLGCIILLMSFFFKKAG